MVEAQLTLLNICALFDVPVVFNNTYPAAGVITIGRGWETKIFLRTDTNPKKLLLSLAHEVGHLLDFEAEPLRKEEVDWKPNKYRVQREEQAWKIAYRLLGRAGCFPAMTARFNRLSRKGLESYRKANRRS